MPRLVLQSRFLRSGLTYVVDVAPDGAVVVHREGRAVAIGAERDGTWLLFGGKPAVWEAAVQSALPAPFLGT